MSDHLPPELIDLDRANRALAESKSLDEIKSIRDKAEAARKYSESAALGLKIQNYAAELKLRAERRAGAMLANMFLRGGDRKSNSHRESLTLADLGINHNQSSRWHCEASIPEQAFEKYIATSNKSGKHITATALLSLGRRAVHRSHLPAATRKEKRKQSAKDQNRTRQVDLQPNTPLTIISLSCEPEQHDVSPLELVTDVKNHRELLASILKPFYNNRKHELRHVERKMIDRLLTDLDRLMCHLEQVLKSGNCGVRRHHDQGS